MTRTLIRKPIARGNKSIIASKTSRKRPHNRECPISIKWIIAEEKLEALKCSTTDGFLETEWFDAYNIPGVQYQLKIYPTGNSEAYRDNVMVYLHLELENETKIKADVKFSVESAVFTTKENFEYKVSIGNGYFQSSTTEFFDPSMKFIVDGKFTLKCEGLLWAEREKPVSNGNVISFNDGTLGHKLLKNGYKGFTINVGGSSIQVHKCVLASQSPVFKAMFESGMKESEQNQMDVIDFSLKVVDSVIQLLYNIELTMDMNDKMGALQFCDKYDISDLKSRIEDSLIENVSTSTVCQLANCSIITNALKLQEKCDELLTESFQRGTPVIDIDILDKDLLLKAVKNASCTISET